MLVCTMRAPYTMPNVELSALRCRRRVLVILTYKCPSLTLQIDIEGVYTTKNNISYPGGQPPIFGLQWTPETIKGWCLFLVSMTPLEHF